MSVVHRLFSISPEVFHYIKEDEESVHVIVLNLGLNFVLMNGTVPNADELSSFISSTRQAKNTDLLFSFGDSCLTVDSI